MMQIFKKTPKQIEAIKLLGGIARYIMLYGGSRSGKTFIALFAIIVRASICRDSRHLIVRLKFNHAKTSIWLDTLPKVFKICFPDLIYHPQNSDFYITLPNGSEIWVAGLDDKIRTEKILGKEFSTIFFNECSQIPYNSVNMALTRLAQKNSLTKKAYFDENPPSKRHWSFSLFLLFKNPEEWNDVNPEKYASILMNPQDNIENIDEDYITEILDQLPAKERNRFKHGSFGEADAGAIYYAFDAEQNVAELKRNNSQIFVGMDFNVNPMTAIVCEIQNDCIYVFDEFFLENSNTYEIADKLYNKYGKDLNIIPDSTGKARKTSSKESDHQILKNKGFTVEKVSNPFREDRFNTVNGLLEEIRIIVHPRCKYTIKDLEQMNHEFTDKELNERKLGHITDGLGYVAWKKFPMKKIKGKSSSYQM